MTIKVTQKHIDEGQRGDCLRCAVSLAVVESAANLPEGSFALVSFSLEHKLLISVTRAQYPGTNHFLTLSPEFEESVCMFIRRFDSEQLVAPFEFEASVHPPFPV